MLASLGVEPKGCIVALNKCDRLRDGPPAAPPDRDVVAISARTGQGVDVLQQRVRTVVLGQPGIEVMRFPAAGGEELQRALREETIVARRFAPSGIELVVRRR